MPFWTTTIVVDMVTDLVMILLPIYIVSRLKLAYHKKVVVILIFMVRLLYAKFPFELRSSANDFLLGS